MKADGVPETATILEAFGQVPGPAPITRLRRAWLRALRRPPAFVGAVVVLLFVGMAVGAPWIATTDPLRTNWSQIRKAPTL
ncbi:MAG TPA: hypothetical protein VN648_35505, partial [Candidatus Methylomirabilis sp.]|nr:hypothetical protein [Candidatus Methylomirabilis sp.]